MDFIFCMRETGKRLFCFRLQRNMTRAELADRRDIGY